MIRSLKKHLTALFGIILPAIFFFAVTLTPARAGDVIVPAEKLPATAQSFLKENFAAQKITQVKYDSDPHDKDYEVKLDDGTKIKFSDKGQWLEIEMKNKKALPEKIMPAAMRDYLKKAEEVAVEIEQKSYGYKVEVRSGKELKFDAAGKFLGYDK